MILNRGASSGLAFGQSAWRQWRSLNRRSPLLIAGCRVIGSKGSARQISIISEEFIQSIATNLARSDISPVLLRRNLVVSGINLNALRHQYFQIGEAVFQATALCHPCSRMEAALGKGGLVAMLGHGGLCAKIVESGKIRCGDAVVYLPPGVYQERQMQLC